MKFIRFHSASKSFLAKNQLFIKHSVQTCFLMGTGDAIAQAVVEKKDYNELDFPRTAKFAFVGLIFVGPALTTWYRILNTHIKGGPKLLSGAALRKVALDQLVFAPVFLPACITAIHLANGKSWNYIQNEMKLKYVDILLTNYSVWPAVQFLNFGFIPLKYQVLFNQTVAIFWNSYLSFKVQTDQLVKTSKKYRVE